MDPRQLGGAARRGLVVKRPTLQLAEIAGELEPSGDPVHDEAAQPPAADLVQWIDAIALAMAAGIRVGQRGMLGVAAGATDHAETALTPGRDPEVMDADEVAVFLGVDRNTVYDYAGRGEIPHRRLGKRLLFSRSALVAWLGSCKAASTRKG
jgi:excisionase family DNA binding protein